MLYIKKKGTNVLPFWKNVKIVYKHVIYKCSYMTVMLVSEVCAMQWEEYKKEMLRKIYCLYSFFSL